MDWLVLILAAWSQAGALIALSAICFLDEKVSFTKAVCALIAGPLALNKEWWIR